MNTWPAVLPSPSIDLAGDFSAPVIRTEFEGRTRQRLRFPDAAVESWNVSWTFNGVEWAIFKAYFVHTLEQGTQFFDLELPTGNGMEVVSVRFAGGSYKHSYLPHMNCRVTATIETEEPVINSEQWLFVITEFGASEAAALEFFNNLHEFVHEDCPDLIP